MKKEFTKLISLLLSSVFLINFASAQFSLSEFFGGVASSTIVLGAIWIASFSLVHFAMLKFMKADNAAPAAAVAFAISTLITWAVNKSGINLDNFLSSVGISSEMLSSILIFLVIAVIFLLFFMLKTRAFLVIGGILVALSFTNLIQEKATLLVAGLIIFGIGVVIEINKKKKKKVKAPEGIS